MRAPGGIRSRAIVAVLATAIAGIIACGQSSEPGPAFAATAASAGKPEAPVAPAREVSHPSHPSHPSHLPHPSHPSHLPHPSHLSHLPHPSHLPHLSLLVALLAQSPPVTGATARYKVTLEFHGVWGLVTDASGTCPGVPPGVDTLTGVVQELRSDDDEGSVYTGDFTRTSEVGLCEEQETPDGGRWCAGHLKGGGPVHVTLTIPALGNDNEQARVKLEPAAMAWATVSGSCSSLDNAAVAADYRAGDSIYFDTVNASGTSFLPTGKLTVGVFKQTRLAGPGGDGYTMKVDLAP